MAEIIIAIVTGVCSIIGVIISSQASAAKLQQQLEVSQAVMNTRLDNLTAEVRQHNNFAQRMPVVEEQIKQMREQIRTLESDLEKLEADVHGK